MKPTSYIPLLGAVTICFLVFTWSSSSSPSASPIQYEYAGVRFDGDLKTQVFLPGGVTNRLYAMTPIRRPARVDERMFDLTLAMNVLAAEGYEPMPAMTSTDLDLFFRRPKR